MGYSLPPFQGSRALAPEGLTRDDGYRQEVLWLAHDLRFNALRCVGRGLRDAEAEQLTRWAERLERAGTTRWMAQDVCDELTSTLDRRRLLELAAEVIARQQRIRVLLFEWRQNIGSLSEPHYDQSRTEPRIVELPLIVVEKGKTIRICQAIRWHLYPEDELLVKVTASPGLTVPTELKLEFEKHNLEFEYDVKVGENIGESVIVLTPAVGQSVTVYVSVK